MMGMENIIFGYFEDTLTDHEFDLLVKWIDECDENARDFARVSLMESQVRDDLRRREMGLMSLGGADEIALDVLSDSDHVSHVISMLASEESTLDDKKLVDITEAIIAQKNKVRDDQNRDRLKFDLLKKKNADLKHRHFVISRPLLYGSFVAAILLITVLIQTQIPDSTQDHKPLILVHRQPVVGTLTDGMGLAWGDNGHPIEFGSELRRGNFALTTGFVQVTLRQGASVIFEAPCAFELLGENEVRLTRGRAVATVPQAAKGFTIHTATSEIVDYGTEFGVEVHGDNATDVVVFKGLIELREVSDGSGYTPLVKKITAGWAGKIDSGGALNEDLLIHSDVSGSYIRQVPDSVYAASVLRSRPFVYWQFNESVRGEYPNAMGEFYACKTVGDIHLNDDAVNKGVVFPKGGKRDSYIFVDGVLQELRGSYEYTVEAWIKPSEHNHSTIVAFLDPSQEKGKKGNMVMMLEILGGKGSIARRHDRNVVRFVHRNPPSGGGGTEIGTEESYRLNAWQHLVAVKREKEMVVYLNGVIIGSMADDSKVGLSPKLHIGRLWTDRDGKSPSGDMRRNYFGEMDEIAIYDHALTLDEILEHHRQFEAQLELREVE